METIDKQQVWAERLATCEGSGMSRRAWCSAHGVNVNTYTYWHRRLRAPPAPTRAKPRRQALVPVRVQSSATPSASIEITLPSGITLRSPANIDVRWLAALVREIGAC